MPKGWRGESRRHSEAATKRRMDRRGKGKYIIVFSPNMAKQIDTETPSFFPTYKAAYKYGVNRFGSGSLESGDSAYVGWAIRRIK